MFQRDPKPIFTFTTTKNMRGCFAVGIIVAAGLAWAGATGCAAAQQREWVAECVRRLGVRGNNNFTDIRRLAEAPQMSTRLLVRELHPIPEVRILASQDIPSAEHVLWTIRALRYVTGGKDFCSATKYKFGDSKLEQRRRYWLYFGHHNCVSFFAMWPSRGAVFIAPEDAQREIISKWRRWFATYGSSFPYKPLQNPKPWQWLW